MLFFFHLVQRDVAECLWHPEREGERRERGREGGSGAGGGITNDLYKKRIKKETNQRLFACWKLI